MKKISLKLKVTLWYTLVMIIVSSVVLLAVSSIGKDMIEQDVSRRLEKTVDNFAMFFVNHEGRIRPIPMRGFYDKGVHLVVFDSEGQLQGGNIPFGISAKMEFAEGKLRKEVYDNNVYYVYDRKTRIMQDGKYLWVKGFVAFGEEQYALNSVMRNNLIITFVLIIFAACGGYFIISRAFVPVNKIVKTAKQIAESNDLTSRIQLGKGNDEIHELANTFDDMLDKIEYSFECEKQFTSDASHELRTPVAVILSECDYICECIEPENDLKESIDSIKRQAEKMSKLISELLTISRMDRDTVPMNMEKTNISEVLSFVCDEQEEINSSDIVLVRDIDSELYALADTGLMARMFINLIANAYQYSKEKGEICVSLKQKENKILFSVRDDGIGISKENIKKIFERFYQADTSRTAKENGSMGLGLAMVKWICERHGGEIIVESELGKGSIFKVEFPANLS